MSLAVVRTLDEDAWREFVVRQPAGNIFHTPEMFHALASTRGYRPELWACVDDVGRIMALLVPVRITVNRLSPQLTTRSVAYGGPLFVPGAEGLQALDTLLQAYLRSVDGTLFTELRHLSSQDKAQAVLANWNFTYQEHLNYLIPLNRTVEDIFQSIGSRTRKCLRHALNQNKVTVKEVINREELTACYNLLKLTYHRARVPLPPCSLFEALFDELLPRGMVRFSLALFGESPSAISVDLLFKGTIYGWYGGTDRAYRSFSPNELLTWNVLEWGARCGYDSYDFGGAGKPEEAYGVRDFKAKFGGQLVNYGRNICVHSPNLLRLSRWGYALLERLGGTGQILSSAWDKLRVERHA